MDWMRLAHAARNRRLSLDLDQTEVAARAGLSSITISKIENGHSVKLRTLWKLDKGLDWQPGSAAQVASDGLPPVELPYAGEIYTDPDERKIWQITDLSEERRREWIGQLRKLRDDQQRSAEDGP